MECPARTDTSSGLTPAAARLANKASATERQVGSSPGGSLSPCPSMSKQRQRKVGGNLRTTSSQHLAWKPVAWTSTTVACGVPTSAAGHHSQSAACRPPPTGNRRSLGCGRALTIVVVVARPRGKAAGRGGEGRSLPLSFRGAEHTLPPDVSAQLANHPILEYGSSNCRTQGISAIGKGIRGCSSARSHCKDKTLMCRPHCCINLRHHAAYVCRCRLVSSPSSSAAGTTWAFGGQKSRSTPPASTPG
mmetsp:Transcript_11440/g.40672  ORF Transcript_11440/g.40672 Transcript_11440/m.40672 type:complete len:247 (-) Transcript_11440:62-802(-)